MKLFVAIPLADGRLTAETCRALLNEQGAAMLLGIDMTVNFVTCSGIAFARNQAVSEFLATDCDRLMFVDSDVGWQPGDLIKIALRPQEFVGGAYRYRQEPEGYPVEWLDRAELRADAESGLLEVACLPGGFLALHRTVFDKMRAAFPAREYLSHGRQFYGFFHMPPGKGEDGTFCLEWRSIGGSVWLDPELTLLHVDGTRTFTGCIGDWLRARMNADGR